MLGRFDENLSDLHDNHNVMVVMGPCFQPMYAIASESTEPNQVGEPLISSAISSSICLAGPPPPFDSLYSTHPLSSP